MKTFLVFVFFLFGFLAYSCVAPPDVGTKNVPVKNELIKAVDQQVSAKFVMVAQEENLPAPDTPEPVKWVDENLGTLVTTIVLAVYEFLIRKIPTSKTLSLLSNLYKLLTVFFPADKSKNGGAFKIIEAPPKKE